MTAGSARPLRIAVVSNAVPPAVRGGAERHAAELASWLAARHSVAVIAGSGPHAVGDARDYRLPARPQLDRNARASAKALWHLREQWMPSVHRALRAHLAELRPDVVHTHECQGLSAAVFTAISAAGVPHVHTAHDYNLICARVTLTRASEFCGARCATCLPQRLLRRRAISSGLSRLIAPSDYVREAHVRAGVVSNERAVTIRYGAVPGRRRGGVNSVPARAASFSLGYLGALSAYKGVATLLSAFERAPGDWRLVVAGEGELGREVAARARRDDRINFRGYLEDSEKDDFFDAIDLLVVPSEWEDPSPIVAAEATVRGIPCLVSNRGGLPETPGAFVFPARNAAALLAELRSLAASPTRLGLSRSLLSELRHELLWQTQAERVEAVLAEAAAG